MQRPLTAIAGVVAVALALWVVMHNFQAPKPAGFLPAARAASGGGDAEDGSAPMLALGDASAPSGESGSLLLSDLVGTEIRVAAGRGAALPDGGAVPPLPFAAPQQVRFGVVLVSFGGAQPGPAQPASSRSKSDARTAADKLLIMAAQDFHAAVQQGDPGSAEDIGRVRLGVLEPAPEYVLFTLPVGAVGGPVETPRGFWIVKRLE